MLIVFLCFRDWVRKLLWRVTCSPIVLGGENCVNQSNLVLWSLVFLLYKSNLAYFSMCIFMERKKYNLYKTINTKYVWPMFGKSDFFIFLFLSLSLALSLYIYNSFSITLSLSLSFSLELLDEPQFLEFSIFAKSCKH